MNSRQTIYDRSRQGTDRHIEQQMKELPKHFKFMNPRISPTDVSKIKMIENTLTTIGK
jgi:hypothetical protein